MLLIFLPPSPVLVISAKIKYSQPYVYAGFLQEKKIPANSLLWFRNEAKAVAEKSGTPYRHRWPSGHRLPGHILNDRHTHVAVVITETDYFRPS